MNHLHLMTEYHYHIHLQYHNELISHSDHCILIYNQMLEDYQLRILQSSYLYNLSLFSPPLCL